MLFIKCLQQSLFVFLLIIIILHFRLYLDWCSVYPVLSVFFYLLSCCCYSSACTSLVYLLLYLSSLVIGLFSSLFHYSQIVLYSVPFLFSFCSSFCLIFFLSFYVHLSSPVFPLCKDNPVALFCCVALPIFILVTVVLS